MSTTTTNKTKKSPSEQLLLISGASGFVAGHVLNAFLEKGYKVRGTVRSEATADKVRKSHAKYVDSAQLSFAIVPDIAADGAFDEAVKGGIDGVIHTASPFTFGIEDNEKDLLLPAIHGTTNMLKAVATHAPNVQRVVVTSSFAAIVDPFQGNRPGYTYSEKDWNPTTYEQAKETDSGAVAYCASKALAEQAAFDFVKTHKPGCSFDVTTICPPMIYGPLAHHVTDLSKLNTSSADIYRFMNGSTETSIGDTGFPQFADVRDVAEAHLRAYENPAAGGERFVCCTEGGFFYQEVCDVLRNHVPEIAAKVPAAEPGWTRPATYSLSSQKAADVLGMKFRSLEECITDTAKSLLEIEKTLKAE